MQLALQRIVQQAAPDLTHIEATMADHARRYRARTQNIGTIPLQAPDQE
ncbi:hypothetical protein [Streptomyces lavendulae]